MLDLDLNNIYKLLKEKGLNPSFQNAGQIAVTLTIKKHELPVFFSIISEGTLLQIVAYIPFSMHEKAINEASRLLHFVNREIDMPGFGMDEKERLIFYRLVMPCLDKKFDERLLYNYIAALQIASETFIDAIGLIASGTSSFERIKKEKK